MRTSYIISTHIDVNILNNNNVKIIIYKHNFYI